MMLAYQTWHDVCANGVIYLVERCCVCLDLLHALVLFVHHLVHLLVQLLRVTRANSSTAVSGGP